MEYFNHDAILFMIEYGSFTCVNSHDQKKNNSSKLIKSSEMNERNLIVSVSNFY